MATNEILDCIREKDKNENLYEVYSEMRQLFVEGSPDYNRITNLMETKFGKKLKRDDRNNEIQFEYVTETKEDWFFTLRAKDIEPMLNNHYKEEDGVLYKNIEPKSYLLDEDLYVRLFVTNFRAEDPESRTRDSIIIAQGTKEVRDKNKKARAIKPIWQVLKRIRHNDKSEEDTLVRLLADKTPDWYRTVRALKVYGESHGYDESHYRICLSRFISHYNAPLRSITDDMEASKLATFLSSLTIPESKFEMIESGIQDLVRKPKQSIRKILSELLVLAERLYEDKSVEEKKILINKQMKNGLLAFTAGQVRLNLISTIDTCIKNSQEVSWEKLLEGAELSESIHGSPDIALRFNTAIEQSIHNFNVDTRIYTSPNTGVSTEIKTGPSHKSPRRKTHTVQSKDIPTKLFLPSEPPERKKRDVYIREERVVTRQLARQNEGEEIEVAAAAAAAGQPRDRIPSVSEQVLEQRNAQVQEQLRQLKEDEIYLQQRPRTESKSSRVEESGNESDDDRLLDTSKDRSVLIDMSDTDDNAQINHINLVDTLVSKIGALLETETKRREKLKSDQNRPNQQTTRNRSRSPSQNRNRSSNSKYKDQNYQDGRNKSYSDRRPLSPNRQFSSQSRESRSPYRNSRSPYRDNRSPNRRNYSPSRYNSDNRQYNRQNSRDNSRERTRTSSNNYDNRPSRSRSQNYSSQRNSRSNSRDYNSNSYRRSRSFSNERRDYRQSRDSSNQRSNSKDRGWSFSDMEKGINCARDYDPRKEKHCLKCMTNDDHHEFLCKTYYRRGKFQCSKCNGGFHFPEECTKNDKNQKNN